MRLDELRKLAEAAEPMPFDTSPSDVPYEARVALQEACDATTVLQLIAVAEAAKKAGDALDVAVAGLEWYRDACPGDVNGSDEEADEVIGEALAALRAALAALNDAQEEKA